MGGLQGTSRPPPPGHGGWAGGGPEPVGSGAQVSTPLSLHHRPSP